MQLGERERRRVALCAKYSSVQWRAHVAARCTKGSRKYISRGSLCESRLDPTCDSAGLALECGSCQGCLLFRGYCWALSSVSSLRTHFDPLTCCSAAHILHYAHSASLFDETRRAKHDATHELVLSSVISPNVHSMIGRPTSRTDCPLECLTPTETTPPGLQACLVV